MSDMDSFDVASIRVWSAGLAVLPLSTLLIGVDLSRVDQTGYLVLGWAAIVGTFLGLLLAFYNVKRFGATASAMTTYVMPVVAGIGGWFLLGEQITVGMIAGMILIVVGITILNQRELVADHTTDPV